MEPIAGSATLRIVWSMMVMNIATTYSAPATRGGGTSFSSGRDAGPASVIDIDVSVN